MGDGVGQSEKGNWRELKDVALRSAVSNCG